MHGRGVVPLPAIREATESCFCVSRSSWGHALQASSVRTLLLRLAPKAGVEKHVHPHGLCHTCAAELAMERIPVHVIRKQLGHASLHTMTVHLRHIAPVELADSMRRRSWNL